MEIDANRIGVIIIVAMITVILSGAVLSYANPYYSNFNAERNGSEIDYSIDSNLSLDYTAVSMYNGNYNIEQYVAFYDESYESLANSALTGLQWLQNNLEKYRINLLILEVGDVADIVNNLDTTTALVFATGTLPGEIYRGDASDPIFKWLKAGGVMYWMNGKIGTTYVDKESDPIKVPDADILFFNHELVIREGDNTVYNRDLVAGSLTDVLGIYYNEYTNGVYTDRMTGSYLSLDYWWDGYSAVTFVKYHDGDGMICNLGGSLTRHTAPLVAQVIASGLTYDSALIDYHKGQLGIDPKGTLQSAAGTTDIFIYIGKMNVIGGQCFRLP